MLPWDCLLCTGNCLESKGELLPLEHWHSVVEDAWWKKETYVEYIFSLYPWKFDYLIKTILNKSWDGKEEMRMSIIKQEKETTLRFQGEGSKRGKSMLIKSLKEMEERKSQELTGMLDLGLIRKGCSLVLQTTAKYS